MTYSRRKRRKKIRKKDVKLFIAMCAIALVIGAMLTLLYGRGDDVRGLLTESLIEEYKHRSGKKAVDPATRRRIESAVDRAAGEADR